MSSICENGGTEPRRIISRVDSVPMLALWGDSTTAKQEAMQSGSPFMQMGSASISPVRWHRLPEGALHHWNAEGWGQSKW